jgi:hypothetical protein
MASVIVICCQHVKPDLVWMKGFATHFPGEYTTRDLTLPEQEERNSG